MGEIRKAQVLLESEEYEYLEGIASRRGISVPELIRQTVRERYLPAARNRQEAAAAILRMEIPVEWGDWETVEQEIEGAHDGGLS